MSTPEKTANGSTILPNHLRSWRRFAWRPFLERLKRSDAPIIVGPWHGEVGFESLYWLPFIEHLVHVHGISKERLIPVSRGGAAIWYGAPKGLELYSMRTVQQVRIQNRLDVQRTGTFKQNAVTDFDRAVVKDVADTLNLKRYHVLHPAWMYHLLAPFWTAWKGSEWLSKHIAIGPLSVPKVEGITLPEPFVGVRFYARDTFNPQMDKTIMPFIKGVLEQLTGEYNVVLLDHDLYVDDHTDLTRMMKGNRIHHMSEFVSVMPENNLAMTSAILGRAMGFVGTYGGFAQLALRLGKPSVSYYNHFYGTSIVHKSFMDLLSVRTGIPAYVARIGDLPMLNAALPVVTVTERGKPLNAAKQDLQTQQVSA